MTNADSESDLRGMILAGLGPIFARLTTWLAQSHKILYVALGRLKTTPREFGRVILFLLIISSMIASYPRSAHGATGNVLAGPFVPHSGNGRAIAFDGAKLYTTYTNPDNIAILYIVSTAGVLQSTLTISGATGCGALSWDGSKLWCGTYDSAGNVYTIDPATGVATFQFTASPPMGFPSTSCPVQPTGVQPAGSLDGLALNPLDSPKSMWISDDEATQVDHFTTGGVLLSTFSPSITIGGVTYTCNSGIGTDGTNLWLSLFGPTPLPAQPPAVIAQFTQAGIYTGVSFGTGLPTEGLAFDSVTFAPKCAMWSIADGSGGQIYAYEIPCTNFGATPLATFDPVSENGRGLAFDGTKLYATYYPDTNLYRISTAGALEAVIPISNATGASIQCGSLTWDGGKLWCGSYDGQGKVYTLDRLTGLATFQFTATPPVGGSCFPQPAGYLDGLAFNSFSSPTSLWIGDDGATSAYHFSSSGALSDSFSGPFAAINGVTYGCRSGVAFDGANLWLSIYAKVTGFPYVDLATNRIAQFTTAGVFTGSSLATGTTVEGLALDAVTFAPKCVVWALTDGVPVPGTIQAFQVPCGNARDFQLSARPSSSTISPGSSTSATVAVNSTGGFAGSVSFTATVSPIVANGPTSSLNPNPVTLAAGGSATSTMTISTTPSTPSGTYTLTVTGVSGSITHSAVVSLTVTPDFGLSPSPLSLVFSAGASGSSTITVNSLGGFAGTVSLSTTVSPVVTNGPTASLNPLSVTLTAGGSATSTIAISTTTSTPSNSYIVNVTGTSGSQSHSAIVAVHITIDFGISASPPSLSLNSGSSGSSTITVNSNGGFAGTVSLSTSVSPVVANGPTGSLSTSSVTLISGGSATLTLTLSTARNSPPGKYSVSVVGGSGFITHVATLSLTLSSSFDFSVTASGGITAPQGATGSNAISVSPTGWGLQSVNLSCSSGLPGGASCSFSPASGTPTFSSFLVISTSSTTSTGSYAITVTGVGGGVTHTTQFTLTVNLAGSGGGGGGSSACTFCPKPD